MHRFFSLKNSLDLLAALVAVVALAAVVQTFVIGKHYVIPTMILFVVIVFGNLARFGMRGARWAKQILFWIFTLTAFHAFFALFWAAKPREIFGAAFPYLYGGYLVLMIGLLVPYARQNRVLAGGGEK